MIKGEDVLIYDIETKTFGKPDINLDELKFFGYYSYKYDKYDVITDIDEIQEVINDHKFLVGFNNQGEVNFMNNINDVNEKGYDNPILLRSGINLDYKIFIDLKMIFKKRAGSMKVKKGMLGELLMRYSLDFISRTVGIVDDDSAKLDFDYKIFNKNAWTKDELELINDYTIRDIEVTKKLYEWVCNYFDSFKHFVSQEDIDKKKYLTCSTAAFAYKSICKRLGIKEEYSNDKRKGTFGGGFVGYPAGERFDSKDGKIFYYDYSSLYPNIIMQFNLQNKKCDCCSDKELWRGSSLFKVNGAYCTKKLTPRNQLLKDWFLERKELKKINDPKEYSIKINLNSTYGAMTNQSFKNIYDLIAGSDCTSLGRQIIKYSRKKFREAGYLNLMSDTDSVCVQAINGQSLEDANKVARQIVKDIQKHMLFPWNEFEFELENEIKYAFFFKGKNQNDKESDKEMDEDDFINKPKGLMKKNYVMITMDDNHIVSNLGVKKKSTSLLTRKLFWDYLLPKIKSGGQVKFSKSYIKDLIYKLLEDDIGLASMRKMVGNVNQYKGVSSQPAQIAKKYGSGIHFMIPNVRGIGVGKAKKLCTVEEFKERGLKIKDIDLSNVWKELDYFIKSPVTKNIFDYV